MTPPQPIANDLVAITWDLAFADEFAGDRLDTSRWIDVSTGTAGISVSDGCLTLALADPSAQPKLCSSPVLQGWSTETGFEISVEDFVQARIRFPGSGATIYNWPAFWTSGTDWPENGEHDVAEGLGSLTSNYHYGSGAGTGMNSGPVAGDWGGSFHTFGMHRGGVTCSIYWDGELIRSYRRQDRGGPHSLILSNGTGDNAATNVFGAGSEMVVDHVRAWVPATERPAEPRPAARWPRFRRSR